MTRLSDDQIIAYTNAAMAPYRCVAEFSDYGARFGFAVYTTDEWRFVNEDILTKDIRHSKNLERMLLDYRSGIHAQHKVDFSPWDGIPVQTDC